MHHSRPAPPANKPVFHPELPHRKTDVQPFQFESRYENKPSRRDIVDGALKQQEEELIKVSCVLILVLRLVNLRNVFLIMY